MIMRRLGLFVALALLGSLLLPAPAQAATLPNEATSVTVIMIENHGRASAAKSLPKITALGKRYATATNAYAITHPSKPNYLATWSGSTQGETSNRFAIEKGMSLFDEVYAAGAKVKTYAQSMGSDRCRQSNHGAYAWRHNPQVVFTATKAKRTLCERYNFDGFDSHHYWQADLKADKLGVLNHVLPDVDHDWHDGSARAADDWISARAAEFIASPEYAAGGALVITADEDEKKGANDIPLIVIHKSLDGKHLVTGTKLSLYDLHAFMAEVANVKSLHSSAATGLFARAFRLAA